MPCIDKVFTLVHCRWVDEDEEDEKPEMDLSGLDFSGFGGGELWVQAMTMMMVILVKRWGAERWAWVGACTLERLTFAASSMDWELG